MKIRKWLGLHKIVGLIIFASFLGACSHGNVKSASEDYSDILMSRVAIKDISENGKGE